MPKFNVGDMVIMTREPTAQEWAEVGQVTLPQEYYEKPHQVVRLSQRVDAIQLTLNDYVYPSSCFELAHNHAAEQYKKDAQKKALLEEAMRNYPPGTRFYNSYGSISTVAKDPNYILSSSDRGIYVNTNAGHGTSAYIYRQPKNEWAQIISGNRTEAKPCDYIVILDGRGNSDLKYKTFYVVSVTDGGHFELAEPGKGLDSTISWICSDPSFYKIKHPSEVAEEPEPKEYSDIGMSNYEPPKQFKVGDNVKVIVDGMWFNAGQVAKILEIHGDIIQMYSTKRSKVLGIHKAYIEHTDDIPVITDEYPRYKVGDTVVGLPSASKQYTLTQEGWEGVIAYVHDGGKYFDANSIKDGQPFHGLEPRHFTLKASKSEGLIYKIDLPAFDRTKLEEQYFKTKTQKNGTENQQSVKLQGVNLKIREGNLIRGIRLKSSGSKIKLGSNYSYN